MTPHFEGCIPFSTPDWVARRRRSASFGVPSNTATAVSSQGCTSRAELFVPPHIPQSSGSKSIELLLDRIPNLVHPWGLRTGHIQEGSQPGPRLDRKARTGKDRTAQWGFKRNQACSFLVFLREKVSKILYPYQPGHLVESGWSLGWGAGTETPTSHRNKHPLSRLRDRSLKMSERTRKICYTIFFSGIWQT